MIKKLKTEKVKTADRRKNEIPKKILPLPSDAKHKTCIWLISLTLIN